MHGAEQSEETPRGFVVDLDLAFETRAKKRRTLVVYDAAAHVDRLDAGQGRSLDCLVIGVADLRIVLDDAAKGGKAEADTAHGFALHIANVEDEPVLLDQKLEVIRPAGDADGGKKILLQKIEDRDASLVLDIGAAPRDRGLVENDFCDAVRFGQGGPRGQTWLLRIVTERAWAPRPSASARATAAGPMRPRLSALHFTSVVRLRKSSSERPEEKRAAPDVGNT